MSSNGFDERDVEDLLKGIPVTLGGGKIKVRCMTRVMAMAQGDARVISGDAFAACWSLYRFLSSRRCRATVSRTSCASARTLLGICSTAVNSSSSLITMQGPIRCLNDTTTGDL